MGTTDAKEQATGSLWWLCPIVSLLMAVSLGYLFGLSWWTALLMGCLLACPITAVWTYFFGERPLPIPLGPTPLTRGTNFNWIAPWYDTWCSIFGLGRSFRDWTLAWAQLMPGDHVLDVGCGNGVLTHRIANIVGGTGAAWGIDPAPDMIRLAMQAGGGGRSAAQFKLAAVEALPFENASFDVALVSLVLHHLPADLKMTGLKEILRVLKPGGRICVVEPDRPDHWLLRILVSPGLFYRRLKPHLHGRTSEILQSAGFGSVTALARWKHSTTFWSARKPNSFGTF